MQSEEERMKEFLRSVYIPSLLWFSPLMIFGCWWTWFIQPRDVQSDLRDLKTAHHELLLLHKEQSQQLKESIAIGRQQSADIQQLLYRVHMRDAASATVLRT